MKKIFLLIAAVLICVVFCGCTDFQANYGIDKDCNAYMKYHIKTDLTGMDYEYAQGVRKGYTYLCDFYRHNYNFDAKYTFLGNSSAEIIMTCKKECDSYNQAFEELKSMLTDPELTPFMSVEMAADAAEYEEGYSFTAETDLSKIFATSGYEGFPKDLKEMFSSGIENAKGSFTITLPATTVVESVGKTEIEESFCTETVELSLKEPMKLKLITRLSLEDELPAEVSTDESIKQIHSRFVLFMCLAIALSTLAVLAVVLIIVKKRKTPPEEPTADEAAAVSDEVKAVEE